MGGKGILPFNLMKNNLNTSQLFFSLQMMIEGLSGVHFMNKTSNIGSQDICT